MLALFATADDPAAGRRGEVPALEAGTTAAAAPPAAALEPAPPHVLRHRVPVRRPDVGPDALVGGAELARVEHGLHDGLPRAGPLPRRLDGPLHSLLRCSLHPAKLSLWPRRWPLTSFLSQRSLLEQSLQVVCV